MLFEALDNPRERLLRARQVALGLALPTGVVRTTHVHRPYVCVYTNLSRANFDLREGNSHRGCPPRVVGMCLVRTDQ